MDHTGSSPGKHIQASRNEGSKPWAQRRRFMLATVGFCMATIGYCLWNGLESRVAETAVQMSFLIIGTTVSSYVFGAVWQDISMKTGSSSINLEE